MQRSHQLLNLVESTLLYHCWLICKTLNESIWVLLFDDRCQESLLAGRCALVNPVDYQARDD